MGREASPRSERPSLPPKHLSVVRRAAFLATTAILVAVAVVVLIGPNPPESSVGERDERDRALESLSKEPTERADEGGGREELRATRPPSGTGNVPSAIDPRVGIPSFSGRLLWPDGRPASEAEVKAWGRSGFLVRLDWSNPQQRPLVVWTTQTDTEGRFLLPESPADDLRFILRADASGAAPLELLNLYATPGRTRMLGDLSLEAGGVVRGTVQDNSGRPLSGVTVAPVPDQESDLFRHRHLPTKPGLKGVFTRTEAEGRFVLADLPAGRLRVRASVPGYALGHTAPLLVEPGRAIDDVVLTLSSTGLLVGQVLANEEPLPGARLRLVVDRVRELSTTSDAEGEFQFDLPQRSGEVTLKCTASGYLPTQLYLDARKLQNPLELRLQTLLPITGHVVDAAGRAVRGAEVRFVSGPESSILPARSSAAETHASTISGPDGRFSINVDLGGTWEHRFRIVATARGYVPAQSENLVLLSHETGHLAPVTLRLIRGADVSGKVLHPNGNDASGARVYLRRLEALKRGRQSTGEEVREVLYETLVCTADGSFHFSGIPAGRYRFQANQPGFSPSRSSELDVQTGGSIPVVLELLPPSAIRGTVRGDRTRFGALRVSAEAPGRAILETAVDGRGGFRFLELTPDIYLLTLREVDPTISDVFFHFGTSEGLPRLEGVLVETGATTEVELVLDPSKSAAVHGTVRVNGKPRNGLRVYLLPRRPGGSNLEAPWRKVARRIRATTTDEHGAYQISQVVSGPVSIVVERGDAWPAGLFQKTMTDGSVRGPCGLARAELSLRAGEVNTVDLDLALGTIEGHLVLPDRRRRMRVRGAAILTPHSGLIGVAERRVELWQDGTFHLFDLPSGPWTVHIDADGFQIDDVRLEVRGEATHVAKLLPRSS